MGRRTIYIDSLERHEYQHQAARNLQQRGVKTLNVVNSLTGVSNGAAQSLSPSGIRNRARSPVDCNSH